MGNQNPGWAAAATEALEEGRMAFGLTGETLYQEITVDGLFRTQCALGFIQGAKKRVPPQCRTFNA